MQEKNVYLEKKKLKFIKIKFRTQEINHQKEEVEEEK